MKIYSLSLIVALAAVSPVFAQDSSEDNEMNRAFACLNSSETREVFNACGEEIQRPEVTVKVIFECKRTTQNAQAFIDCLKNTPKP